MLSVARGMVARDIPTKTLFPRQPRIGEVLSLFQAVRLDVEVDDRISPIGWRNILAFAGSLRQSRTEGGILRFGGNWASLNNSISVRLAGNRGVVPIHHAAPRIASHRRRMTRLAAQLSYSIIVT